jgi:hypothetical protein
MHHQAAAATAAHYFELHSQSAAMLVHSACHTTGAAAWCDTAVAQAAYLQRCQLNGWYVWQLHKTSTLL